MRPMQFKELVRKVLRHNREVGERGLSNMERIRLGASSLPGIGKSSLYAQAAKEEGFEFRTFLASMREPTDLSGGMIQSGAYCDFLRPRFLPEDGQLILFLLDEMGQAHLSMQNACANLHLDHMSGGHRIGNLATIAAAWNPSTARAGSTKLPSQYLNRLLQVTLEADKGDFVDYGQTIGIDETVLAFINWQGEATLHDFNAAREVNATPRSWESVGRVLGLDMPLMMELEAIRGLVGNDHAAAFHGFRKMRSEIVNIPDILTNPDSVELPSKTEVLYATLTVLQNVVTSKTVANAFKWAARINQKELEVFFVKGLVRKDDILVAKAKEGDKTVKPQHFRQGAVYSQWAMSNESKI
jgi:hypothetical protein